MILVDTSVWIDHLHASDPALVAFLDSVEVVQHPLVLGELALGTIANRGRLLGSLSALPSVSIATHAEVMHLVEDRRLYGRGFSLVDAHLLASVLISPGTVLWTRDKNLRAESARCGVSFAEEVG